jgi:uncharacterized membrane protein (DUF2068 family)
LHKDYTSVKGIRAIAIYEAFKGIVVLTVGIGLLTLIHKNIPDFADDLVFDLHLDPAGYFAHLLVETLGKLNTGNIELIFLLTILYAIVRFVEAYGLWLLRGWAEWFAIISGSIYLPVEIYEIFKKPSILKFVVFLANLAIVLYLLYVRREKYLKEHTTIA